MEWRRASSTLISQLRDPGHDLVLDKCGSVDREGHQTCHQAVVIEVSIDAAARASGSFGSRGQGIGALLGSLTPS